MAARRKYTKYDYVQTFPKTVREGIRNALARKLREEFSYYPLGERRELIETGMDGRLVDLKDLINVQYWLDKANGKR